jgi:hypothetical protein
MLTVQCPQHGRRVLLGLGQICRIVNTGSGIEVHYTCTCGYQGRWLTGTKARYRHNGKGPSSGANGASRQCA